MHGNGLTLSGALKRLRLSGTTWMDARATLRALGLLDPFFTDNGAWDLKLKVLKVAEQSKAHFSGVAMTDMALYTLLQEAGLSEIAIAGVAGVKPAQVYQRANHFKGQLGVSEANRASLRQFIDIVVDEVARER